LLQILDDGRITDGQGRTVDFKNTIIIMTSNLGSEYILENDVSKDELINAELKKTFRPEFINRIDEVIIFNSLGTEVIYDILNLTIKNVEARLRDKKLTLSLTDNAKENIINESFDVRYGARGIKRYVAKNIESLIANNILEEKVTFGSHILIDYKDGNYFVK